MHVYSLHLDVGRGATAPPRAAPDRLGRAGACRAAGFAWEQSPCEMHPSEFARIPLGFLLVGHKKFTLPRPQGGVTREF